MLNVVNQHVIELFTNLFHSTHDDEVVIIEGATVSTSRCNLVAWGTELLPRVFFKVKAPEVFQLAILVIFAAKHIHMVVEHFC